MNINIHDGGKGYFFDIHHNENVYIDKLVGTPMPGMGADENEESTETEKQLEAEATDVADKSAVPDGWDSYPEKVFVGFDGAAGAAIREAGATCRCALHYACLMAVCDDHGCLKDRSDKVNFARAMLALRLYEPKNEEDFETAAKRLANNMNTYINAIRVTYKAIPETSLRLKKMKEKCLSLGGYFEKRYVRCVGR